MVAGVVVFEIVTVVWTKSGSGMDVERAAASLPADHSNTAELGKLLYTQYVYPFELAAVLLLVAIVAAIVADHAQARRTQAAGHRQAGGGAP